MSETPPTSALRRTTDGRVGRGDITDIRTWRDEYGERGEMGLAPAAVLILAFVIEIFTGGPAVWGLSAQALSEGRVQTIGLHMISHAGLGHLMANLSALMALTPATMRRFGTLIDAWTKWSILFVVSGLCGAGVFQALNPDGAIPMVGASGAICGLWGFVARFGPDGEPHGLLSSEVRRHIIRFIVFNAVLFVALYLLVTSIDGEGGLAWEAHLGGFVFGLFIAPWLGQGVRPDPLEKED